MAQALIALGGNVGDVGATFERAISALCERAKATLLVRSSNYRTPPWGETDQPDFINACVAIDTPRDPHALLAAMHAVEQDFGRDRAHETRWGPRSLDLDLLAYDDAAVASDTLTLPHPRMFERTFVLVPLAEIAPDRVIAGQTPREALALFDATGIERV